MTAYYKDLPLTKFPNDTDELWNMQDISLATREDAAKYQEAILNGNLREAADLLKNNAALQNTLINAEKMNTINQQILALQAYTKSGRQQIAFSRTQPSDTGTDRQPIDGIWAEVLSADSDPAKLIRPHIKTEDGYSPILLPVDCLQDLHIEAKTVWHGIAVPGSTLEFTVPLRSTYCTFTLVLEFFINRKNIVKPQIHHSYGSIPLMATFYTDSKSSSYYLPWYSVISNGGETARICSKINQNLDCSDSTKIPVVTLNITAKNVPDVRGRICTVEYDSASSSDVTLSRISVYDPQ